METGQPPWDQDAADRLIGKVALIGVDYLDERGQITNRAQFWGVVQSIDQSSGTVVRLSGVWDGRLSSFPPTPEAFRPAPPGEYTLHQTNEIVRNPDFLAVFSRRAPDHAE